MGYHRAGASGGLPGSAVDERPVVEVRLGQDVDVTGVVDLLSTLGGSGRGCSRRHGWTSGTRALLPVILAPTSSVSPVPLPVRRCTATYGSRNASTPLLKGGCQHVAEGGLR